MAMEEFATSGADLFARITIERYTWDTKQQTVRESRNETFQHTRDGRSH
jgi:hypothetical protein